MFSESEAVNDSTCNRFQCFPRPSLNRLEAKTPGGHYFNTLSPSNTDKCCSVLFRVLFVRCATEYDPGLKACRIGSCGKQEMASWNMRTWGSSLQRPWESCQSLFQARLNPLPVHVGYLGPHQHTAQNPDKPYLRPSHCIRIQSIYLTGHGYSNWRMTFCWKGVKGGSGGVGCSQIFKLQTLN